MKTLCKLALLLAISPLNHTLATNALAVGLDLDIFGPTLLHPDVHADYCQDLFEELDEARAAWPHACRMRTTAEGLRTVDWPACKKNQDLKNDLIFALTQANCW